jgi:hypothetical protein
MQAARPEFLFKQRAPLSGDLRDRVSRTQYATPLPFGGCLFAALQTHRSPETHLEFFCNQLTLLIEITSEEQCLIVHLPERFRAVAPSAVLQHNTLSDQVFMSEAIVTECG